MINNQTMNLNNFFKLYSKYLFIPLYFMIGFLFQLVKIHNDEIDKLYLIDDYEEEEFEKKKIDYVMILNKNDFENLKKNKNIFLKEYKTIENNQEYLNILTLRDNIYYAVDFYKPLHFFYLNYYLENRKNSFSWYKLNNKTNDLIINIPKDNNNLLIKNIIYDNFTEIINILSLDNKSYSNKSFSNPKELYDEWIKPIEPSDKENYNELIKFKLDKISIEHESNNYIDILCIRNFIQKDFFLNLKELNENEKSKFNNLICQYTIYRTEYSNPDNIITIIQ